MSTIRKYEIPVETRPVISLPKYARILHVAFQQGMEERLFLWAEIEPTDEMDPKTFLVVGTGESFTPSGKEEHRDFIGTAITKSGAFVVHVYQIWPFTDADK